MKTKLISGLVVGSVIGGGLALLFAPKRGAQARSERAREQAELNDLIQDLTLKEQAVTNNLAHLQRVTTEELPAFMQTSKQRLTDFQFQVKPRAKAITQQLKKIKDQLPQKEGK